MAKRQKAWAHSPAKRRKPQVPESLKTEVTAKANELVEKVLKPSHIEPPPEEPQFNYVVDIKTRWYRSYFYLYSTLFCPGPTDLPPYFDLDFARLEYVGRGRFSLAFRRHTGRWQEVYQGLTLDEGLAVIEEDPLFWP